MGLLIATSSGLCSLYFIVLLMSASNGDPTSLVLPLLVGGLPFAAGVGLVLWGRWLLSEAADSNSERGP